MGLALVGVLTATASAFASVAEPSRNDALSVNGGAAACAASQCGLVEQKSAVRALAMAAGASLDQPMDRPAIIPEKVRTAPNSSSDEEPILFTVITPSRLGRSQFCLEEGNLLGLDPTCARPRSAAGLSSSLDCSNGIGLNRFGRVCNPGEDPDPCTNGVGLNRVGALLCRPPGQAPEPGTLVLLAMSLLALAAARVRHKASPARL
jgi:PEP-CTERM motif-containing protein